MATTERDYNEAKAYIEESINYWSMETEINMIIKLAKVAEKMRTPKITPTMRKNAFEKNINALKVVMDRNLKLDPEFDNSSFQAVLNNVQSELNELMKTYIKPIPRKRTKKQ